MKISFFGVDSKTGRSAYEAMELDEVAQLAPGGTNAALDAQAVRDKAKQNANDTLGPTADVDDLNDLGQTGWGIVWGPSVTQDIKDALQPLIDRRKQIISATKKKNDKRDLFRELECKPNDTLESVRQRWGFGPGPVNPGTVPAYLMIVGSPEDISFDLQHDLDVDFFVGRLDLDSAADYAEYAKGVVRAEMNAPRPKSAVFWGTQHDDPTDATQQSMPKLITPLAQFIEELDVVPVTRKFKDDATKAALSKAFGPNAPGLLFTASHGDVFSSFASDDERATQIAGQGALVTQDWLKDPNRFTPLEEGERFAASDVKDSLDGMIAILFACYGGGTPKKSRFPYNLKEGIRDLAPKSFTAQLPKTMLAKGAGAVLGHVERAWDAGFTWDKVQDPQISAWTSVVQGLLKNWRMGRCVAFLNERYSSIAAQLSRELTNEQNNGIVIPLDRRAYLWTQHEDSRSWMVLGDPAAKLAMA